MGPIPQPFTIGGRQRRGTSYFERSPNDGVPDARRVGRRVRDRLGAGSCRTECQEGPSPGRRNADALPRQMDDRPPRQPREADLLHQRRCLRTVRSGRDPMQEHGMGRHRRDLEVPRRDGRSVQIRRNDGVVRGLLAAGRPLHPGGLLRRRIRPLPHAEGKGVEESKCRRGHLRRSRRRSETAGLLQRGRSGGRAREDLFPGQLDLLCDGSFLPLHHTRCLLLSAAWSAGGRRGERRVGRGRWTWSGWRLGSGWRRRLPRGRWPGRSEPSASWQRRRPASLHRVPLILELFTNICCFVFIVWPGDRWNLLGRSRCRGTPKLDVWPEPGAAAATEAVLSDDVWTPEHVSLGPASIVVRIVLFRVILVVEFHRDFAHVDRLRRDSQAVDTRCILDCISNKLAK